MERVRFDATVRLWTLKYRTGGTNYLPERIIKKMRKEEELALVQAHRRFHEMALDRSSLWSRWIYHFFPEELPTQLTDTLLALYDQGAEGLPDDSVALLPTKVNATDSSSAEEGLPHIQVEIHKVAVLELVEKRM